MKTPLYPVLFLLAACGGDGPEARPTFEITGAAGQAVPSPASHAAGAECHTDNHGLCLTALVRYPDVHASATPGGKPGPALTQFAPPLFVFEMSPEHGPAEFLEVGTSARRTSILGWVRADQVVLSNSRIGVEPAGGELSLFADLDRLRKDQPFARCTPDGLRPPFLWPVTESRNLTLGGVEREALRVHVLVQEGPPRARTGAASRTGATPRQDLALLDCVVLLDGTGSMQKFLDGVLPMVEGLVTRLAKAGKGADLDVRLRLIVFRDKDTTPLLQAFKLTDEAGFKADLQRVKPHGGGDAPEAGLQALAAGLDTPWRGSALSTRVLFVVSDASFHEGGAIPSQTGLVKRARDLGVRIYGLAVGQNQGSADRELQLTQYRGLAKGTRGEALTIEQMERAAAHVESILSEASLRVAQRTQVFDQVQEGTSDAAEIARRTGLARVEVTRILRFLEGGGVQLDPKRADQPQFASGWLRADQVRRRSLISASELELALAALHALRSDLSPRSALATFGVATALRANPSDALAHLVPDPEQEVAVALAARGIPAGPKSVLRRSRRELAQAGERERNRLRQRVSRAIEDLWAFRTDADRWVVLDGGESWAFIPEEVLP
jgi:von Willebrand factor type A domain